MADRSNPPVDDPFGDNATSIDVSDGHGDDEWLAGTSWRAAFDLPIAPPSFPDIGIEPASQHQEDEMRSKGETRGESFGRGRGRQRPAEPAPASVDAADDDLLDAAARRSSVDDSPSPWMPVAEAGSGTIQEVAESSEPVTVDVAARTPGAKADLGTLTLDPALVGAPGADAVVPSFGDPLGPSGVSPVEPDIDVATALPDGTAIGGVLDGLTVGSISIDTVPDHYGVDAAVGGVVPPSLADVLDLDGTGGGDTPPPADDTGAGSLGPLPGTSLFAAEGDKPLKRFPGDEDNTDPKGILDQIKEIPEKVEQVVKDVVEWVENVPKWLDLGGAGYENPDADPVLVAPSDVMAQIISTGVDPTTTQPGVGDDAEPITSDDLAGAGPVGGLNVPVNPLVIDSSDEVGDAIFGDIGSVGTRLGASGPDVVGPNDPILGGAEPITSITSDDLRPPPGEGTIAGGEDEDLEDLEIQRLTPRLDTQDATLTTGGDAAAESLSPLGLDSGTSLLADDVLAPQVSLQRAAAFDESTASAGSEVVLAVAEPVTGAVTALPSSPTDQVATPPSVDAFAIDAELALSEPVASFTGEPLFAAGFDSIDLFSADLVDESPTDAAREPSLGPDFG